MNLDLTNRKTLVASLPHNGVVAEIGVAEGVFSQAILELNNPVRLYLIDCWQEQSVELCGHDPSNVCQEAQNARYQEVLQRFADHGAVYVLRGFSRCVVNTFATGCLDWIYFDANHLQIYQDLEAWWRCVKSGGWMLGHDYTVAGDYITVKPDVDRFVKERGLELFVAGLENEDVYERNYPTFLFRKP